ncbi:MAG TPA: adenylate/guanylate cyclase domain-containing protein [Candidatus Limnocylindria bacterium]|nr:adenylate/guanylate cyclase domain-containing protein [Candidatus Limnocylindria bacterium]
MQLRRKRFERADETRPFERGRIEVVELGELVVGRAIFEPGWRWSEHLKPIAGTDSCQYHHLGYVLSGQLHVEMNDGASIELRAGDAFEIPPGHDAWVVGDEPWVSVDYAGRRTFAKSPMAVGDRVLSTVVFTDLSRSTEKLREVGDAGWRTLLAEHNQALRAQIERFAGREIDTTGDGFLVLFESPARAVRCAAAMLEAAAGLGLTARAAVHTGEVQLAPDNVRGIAVHAAARILSIARPGEVLVSATVRDLLAGSELAFDDRGEHELRGIGKRALAALVTAPG